MIPIRNGHRDRRQVALTFDDAPHPRLTPLLLEVLRHHDVTATFFCTGEQVEAYPALTREVVARGHEAGNHGYRHLDLTTLSCRGAREEIWRTQETMKSATGSRPRLFRPPYGLYGPRELGLAAREGLLFVLWDVDPRDFELAEESQLRREISRAVNPGSIILLHTNREITVRALPRILEDLWARGLEPVLLKTLLGDAAVPPSSRATD